MNSALLLIFFGIIAMIILFLQNQKLKKAHTSLMADSKKTSEDFEAMKKKYEPIVDVEGERLKVAEEIETIRKEKETIEMQLAKLREGITRLREEFATLEEEENLQAHGLYKPSYDFLTSKQYNERLKEIRDQQKEMVKNERAAISKGTWTVGGSEAKGRKMIRETLKLALRAFNGESEAAVANVTFKNVVAMEKRIRRAFEVINKLVTSQSCEITEEYLNLKLEELALAFEYREKVQEEREEQRQIREQMREEERAQKELEKAQQAAEKEEAMFREALERARKEAESGAASNQEALMAEIEALQQKLAEAAVNKDRAISRAQMTRSGHVYIISNIGSFGEDVYKIGMTRRLDPMDRVRELGDASVPFSFDVHAIIYADDAPGLESALHTRFSTHRVNRINERKEFFRASLEEIAEFVHEHHGDIELTMVAEAREWREGLVLQEELER
ncbi:MAG: DUF4041 domain-containing protein [Ignavibacteriae bacterium]|nr:DUF4041 domain-containing protein [Ignavibacteriota bacterium]MCB9215177.1 DUF4041 domain-containing protein [Ignavibacteria bacterium]